MFGDDLQRLLSTGSRRSTAAECVTDGGRLSGLMRLLGIVNPSDDLAQEVPSVTDVADVAEGSEANKTIKPSMLMHKTATVAPEPISPHAVPEPLADRNKGNQGHNYTGHNYTGHTYISHNDKAITIQAIPT